MYQSVGQCRELINDYMRVGLANSGVVQQSAKAEIRLQMLHVDSLSALPISGIACSPAPPSLRQSFQGVLTAAPTIFASWNSSAALLWPLLLLVSGRFLITPFTSAKLSYIPQISPTKLPRSRILVRLTQSTSTRIRRQLPATDQFQTYSLDKSSPASAP